MTSPIVSKIELTEAELHFYAEQGYLLLPGLIRGEAVATLRREVFESLAASGLPLESLRHASSTADKLRQSVQYLAGSALDALINGPETLAIASQLVGGPAMRYVPFTAVKSGGGGGRFHFHQDNNYDPHDPVFGSLNVWVALEDMTPENGCLQMIPGSHKRGDVTSHRSDDGDHHQQIDVDLRESLPLRMRAGDAVAFTRLTIHGSGPNQTNEPRLAYSLQYFREDVKWRDPKGQWKPLRDGVPYDAPPLKKLGPQK